MEIDTPFLFFHYKCTNGMYLFYFVWYLINGLWNGHFLGSFNVVARFFLGLFEQETVICKYIMGNVGTFTLQRPSFQVAFVMVILSLYP